MSEIEGKIITPAPYYEISTHRTPRRFRELKYEIYTIYCKFNDEMYSDGNTSESCDYEGDLNEIILYRYPETGKDYMGRPVEEGIKKVFEHFELNYEDVPKDMLIYITD